MSIGLDLLDISRLESKLNDSFFMERVFAPAEREYIAGKGRGASASAAGIFCAKEAFAKATGCGLPYALKNTVLLHRPDGSPYIELVGEAVQQYGELLVELSISHTGLLAGAVCSVEKKV